MSDGISSIKFLSRSSNFKLAIVKTELEKPVMTFVLSTKLSVWFLVEDIRQRVGFKLVKEYKRQKNGFSTTHQVSPTMQSHVVSHHQHYSYSN